MKPLDPKGDGYLDNKIAFTPYTLENDAFDVRDFQEIKTHSTKLLRTEEQGSINYEQFPELQQDIYDALYKYDPIVRKDWEIKREFLLNKRIMEELMLSPKYKELRVLTNLDVVNSVVGTELLSAEALELVKKNLAKEQEALQGLIDAGNALDDAMGTPGGKKDPNSMTLEEAKEKYEKAMEAFQAATTREEFKRNVNRIIANIKDSVQETSDLISNWGLGPSGGFEFRDPHEKMALLNRLRSGKLVQIAKLIGRYRNLAQLHRKEKVKVGLDETYTTTQGNHLERLIPSELLRFLNKHTRAQVMSDFMESKTIEYQIRGKEKKGKGPIIICLDSSGSMSGLPEIWSKAVAMVLLEIAREQKRDFYCIHFSSGYRELHVNEFLKGQPFDIENAINMCEYFENGGTEFEPPLNLARQKIGTDSLYSKADVVFVTDGQSVVQDTWLVEFNKWKAENKVNIYSVLIDAWDNSDSTLRQFSDRVDKLSTMKDDQSQDALAVSLFIGM